jgi:hypothetical protein
MGEEHLPCPIPYNSFSSVLEYNLSDTLNDVHAWCSSCAQSDPRRFTEFFEYPIRRKQVSAMPLIIR